ncbi:MAG: DUF294 nucleotidyltransferase-like domain-containing protein [Nannocystaceae bacterium]
MRGPVDYRRIAATIGVDARAIPRIIAAAEGSWARLCAARIRLAELDAPPGIAAFALGSFGRGEAGDASDLDLALLYFDGRCPAAAAGAHRAAVSAALREVGFDVPDKTFDRALDVGALVRDIGGRLDHNDHLTHRALVLTEGAWLHAAAAAREIQDALFQAYAGGTIGRGRFLSALSNDLHRYYRTVTVDYRFKVEVAGKGWALRNLKLRHSRKLWHLANLILFAWAAQVDDDVRDAVIAAHLGEPPLARLAAGMTALGAPERCAPLFVAYDRFLAGIAGADARAELESLAHDARDASATYVSLRDNADRFDDAAAAIVAHLWESKPEHLIRFGLL